MRISLVIIIWFLTYCAFSVIINDDHGVEPVSTEVLDLEGVEDKDELGVFDLGGVVVVGFDLVVQFLGLGYISDDVGCFVFGDVEDVDVDEWLETLDRWIVHILGLADYDQGICAGLKQGNFGTFLHDIVCFSASLLTDRIR